MPKTDEKGSRKGKGLLSMLKPKREHGIEIKARRAKTIGVFSCKGGVGKTTTVASVGAILAEKFDDGVVLVDANLSAPNLGLHLGELDPAITIHDAIADEVPIEKAVLTCNDIHVVLGSIAFGEEIHLVDLRAKLEPLKKNYKLIFIDSAPGVGVEVVAAIKACDEMLIVTSPEVPTIASTLKTFRAAERYKVPIIGAVVNKVLGERFELPIEEVKKALGWPIIAVVPEDRKVREAAAAGVPVTRYAPKSPAAVEFRKLGEFLAKRISQS